MVWALHVACATKGNPTRTGPFFIAATLLAEDGQGWQSWYQLDSATLREAEWESVLMGMELAAEKAATAISLFSDADEVIKTLVDKQPSEMSKYVRIHRKVLELAKSLDQASAWFIPADQNPAKALAQREANQEDFIVWAHMDIKDRICISADSKRAAAHSAFAHAWPSVECAMENEALILYHKAIHEVTQVGISEFEVEGIFSLDVPLYIKTEGASSADALAEVSRHYINTIPERYGFDLVSPASLSKAMLIEPELAHQSGA